MVKDGPIVVGVDGSPGSRGALHVAAEEARIHRRKLRAVMVHGFLDGYAVAGIPVFEPSHVEETRAALGKIIVEELGERPDVEVEQVVTCDLPARGLLAEARNASLWWPTRARAVPFQASSSPSGPLPRMSRLSRGVRTWTIRDAGSASSSARRTSPWSTGLSSRFVEPCHSPHAPMNPAWRTVITSTFAGYDPNNHLAGTTEEQFAEFVGAARAAGMPVFGRVLETDFSRPRGAPVDYRTKLHSTDEELVYCAFHPCRPGPGEVEEIEPGSHHVRVDEYELFGTDDWLAWLEQQPFDVIGMRELRDQWQAGRVGDAVS